MFTKEEAKEIVRKIVERFEYHIDEYNKEQLQARILYTDKKIDSLVYQLYGLTEEEIRIVEGE